MLLLIACPLRPVPPLRSALLDPFSVSFMNPDRATLNFLNAFPEDNRKEGERLQKEGCVVQIFGSIVKIQGKVEEGRSACRTVVKLNGNIWEGECSCHEGANCPSLVAMMMERLARNGELPESPNEVEDQTLTEILVEKLNRPVSENEAKYVEKLEQRYRRFETEGRMTDHDMARLYPKWPIESYDDAIQLWPVPPGDIIQFWNYIAYHFENRNMPYPKFLGVVTDLAAVEHSMREWEREKAEEEWRQTVCAFAEVDLDAPQEMEFRLLLTTSEARLQWKDPQEAEFNTIAQKADLNRLCELYKNGALRLDGASALVWEEFIGGLGEEAEAITLRLESAEQAAVLNRILHTEELAAKLVNLDDREVKLDSRPVSWICEESQIEEEDVFYLQLMSAENEAIPHIVRLLPGLTSLYLGDETAFPGPAFWGEGTEIQPRYAIPSNVILSEPGVAFLGGIGADLPESLKKRIREVAMQVRMKLRLSQKLTGSESENLIVEVDAIDPQETRRETLEKEGWIVAERKESENGVIFRYDRAQLRKFPTIMEPMALTWDAGKKAFRGRVTKTFPEKFVEWYETLPEAFEKEVDEHLSTLMADPVKASVTFDIVASEIDWFDLKIIVNVEGLNLSTQEIKALVAARGGFVRMKDGGWLRLQIDLTEQQTEAVNRLGLDPFDLTGESHRMHVLQLNEPLAKEVFDDEAWNKICERSNALKLQVSPAVPSQLKLELRPYQIEGYQFLSYLSTNGFGGILADDMGLGKTVQAITWLLWLREQEGNSDKPCLVVCPKSVLDVWAGEVKKFAPHLRVRILRNKFELDMDAVANDIDVLVLNYSQLRVNSEPLGTQEWLAMILDEGQQIKNPDSKAAKSARALQSDNRLVLTGTPIENRLLDIWSLMAFAMPGVLGTRKYFRERFDRRKDPRCQERLAARLRPFLLRRTKSQVALDLPPRTEEDVLCKMDGEQEEAYQTEVKRIQQTLLNVDNDEEFNRARFTVLQGLTRLRQICCHPGLYDRSLMEEESAKFTALFYLLDQLKAEGHKVLVFSQFVSMLEIIRERLEEEDRPYTMLTGQTRDRQKVIEEFQTSKDPTVFLLSLKAGGSGLNLTAASYVVLYDPWWNPAVENQAIDRTHRIGQQNKVIAYRLLMRDSVEEKIRVLQKQKEATATGVLGEEGFAKSLTRDDLSFLFETAAE